MCRERNQNKRPRKKRERETETDGYEMGRGATDREKRQEAHRDKETERKKGTSEMSEERNLKRQDKKESINEIIVMMMLSE